MELRYTWYHTYFLILSHTACIPTLFFLYTNAMFSFLFSSFRPLSESVEPKLWKNSLDIIFRLLYALRGIQSHNWDSFSLVSLAGFFLSFSFSRSQRLHAVRNRPRINSDAITPRIPALTFTSIPFTADSCTSSNGRHAMISDALLLFQPLISFRHYTIKVEPRTSLRNWSSKSIFHGNFWIIVNNFIKISHKTSTFKCGDSGPPHIFRYYKEYLFPRSNQPP